MYDTFPYTLSYNDQTLPSNYTIQLHPITIVHNHRITRFTMVPSSKQPSTWTPESPASPGHHWKGDGGHGVAPHVVGPRRVFRRPRRGGRGPVHRNVAVETWDLQEMSDTAGGNSGGKDMEQKKTAFLEKKHRTSFLHSTTIQTGFEWLLKMDF